MTWRRVLLCNADVFPVDGHIKSSYPICSIICRIVSTILRIVIFIVWVEHVAHIEIEFSCSCIININVGVRMFILIFSPPCHSSSTVETAPRSWSIPVMVIAALIVLVVLPDNQKILMGPILGWWKWHCQLGFNFT